MQVQKNLEFGFSPYLKYRHTNLNFVEDGRCPCRCDNMPDLARAMCLLRDCGTSLFTGDFDFHLVVSDVSPPKMLK